MLPLDGIPMQISANGCAYCQENPGMAIRIFLAAIGRVLVCERHAAVISAELIVKNAQIS